MDQEATYEPTGPTAHVPGPRSPLVMDDFMIRTVWRFGGYADGTRKRGRRRAQKRRAYPGMWRALFVMLDLANSARARLCHWRRVFGLILVAHVERVPAPEVVPTPAWSGIRAPQCEGSVSTPTRGSPSRLRVGPAPT
jgi:hypothetical protein